MCRKANNRPEVKIDILTHMLLLLICHYYLPLSLLPCFLAFGVVLVIRPAAPNGSPERPSTASSYTCARGPASPSNLVSVPCAFEYWLRSSSDSCFACPGAGSLLGVFAQHGTAHCVAGQSRWFELRKLLWLRCFRWPCLIGASSTCAVPGCFRWEYPL